MINLPFNVDARLSSLSRRLWPWSLLLFPFYWLPGLQRTQLKITTSNFSLEQTRKGMTLPFLNGTTCLGKNYKTKKNILCGWAVVWQSMKRVYYKFIVCVFTEILLLIINWNLEWKQTKFNLTTSCVQFQTSGLEKTTLKLNRFHIPLKQLLIFLFKGSGHYWELLKKVIIIKPFLIMSYGEKVG